jgi:hypothetical protein
MHLYADKAPRSTRLARAIHRIVVVLGIIWASPLSAIGLLFGIPIVLFRGRVFLIHDTTPALLIRGPFADFLLARHPFGAMCAMAVGHVVIAEEQGLTKQILTHELAHVRQAARWGALFPFAYLAASGWAILRGRDAYWHNTFEIAARNAERHG